MLFRSSSPEASPHVVRVSGHDSGQNSGRDVRDSGPRSASDDLRNYSLRCLRGNGPGCEPDDPVHCRRGVRPRSSLSSGTDYKRGSPAYCGRDSPTNDVLRYAPNDVRYNGLSDFPNAVGGSPPGGGVISQPQAQSLKPQADTPKSHLGRMLRICLIRAEVRALPPPNVPRRGGADIPLTHTKLGHKAEGEA